MEIHIKRHEIWVPDWEGNKQLPEKDQIRFHHRFLTNDERGEFDYVEPYTVGDIQDIAQNAKKTDVDISVLRDNRKIIQDSKGIAKRVISKIDNLEIIDETGTKIVVDTIEKFYQQPDLGSLAVMLETYMLTLSARADTKNSEPLSLSGSDIEKQTEESGSGGQTKPSGSKG